MKIAHLTTAHAWNDVRITLKQARSGVEAGHEVRVFCRDVPVATSDGVSFVRVPRAAGRLARFFVHPLRLARAVREWRPDIIHLHEPELLPVGAVLRRLGHFVVYDAHENFGGLLGQRSWIPRPMRRVANFVTDVAERRLATMMDAVTAAGEDIYDRHRGAQTFLVRNYPLDSEFRERRVVSLGEDGLRIVLGGVLNAGRVVAQLVDAVEQVNEVTRVTLVLAGVPQPADYIEELRRRPGWRFVDYRGALPRQEYLELVASCHLGAALLSAAPNHFGVRANKLFEYLAMGIPAVTSDFPRWREFEAEYGATICVDPSSPKAIAAGIAKVAQNVNVLQQMERNAAAAAARGLRWSAEVPELMRLYHRFSEELK